MSSKIESLKFDLIDNRLSIQTGERTEIIDVIPQQPLLSLSLPYFFPIDFKIDVPVDFNERIPNHYEKIFLEAKEIQGPYTPIPFGLDGPFKDRSESVPGKFIAVLAIDKKFLVPK